MPTFYKRQSGVARRQWNPEKMEKAVKKVRNEEMSVRKAAQKFDVARKRKQASRKAKRVDPFLTCQECKNNQTASNLLRCNKCKAWFHVTCSIFDDACIDCGRKFFLKR